MKTLKEENEALSLLPQAINKIDHVVKLLTNVQD